MRYKLHTPSDDDYVEILLFRNVSNAKLILDRMLQGDFSAAFLQARLVRKIDSQLFNVHLRSVHPMLCLTYHPLLYVPVCNRTTQIPDLFLPLVAASRAVCDCKSHK